MGRVRAGDDAAPASRRSGTRAGHGPDDARRQTAADAESAPGVQRSPRRAATARGATHGARQETRPDAGRSEGVGGDICSGRDLAHWRVIDMAKKVISVIERRLQSGSALDVGSATVPLKDPTLEI